MTIDSAETKQGAVQGVALDNGCTVFRAVPYARADRFMPPLPPASWSGIMACDRFSAICPQNQPVPGSPFSDFFIKEFYPVRQPMSEDSLCLNVWTSAHGSDDRLPVMIWFHGGGMGSGYGHEMEFDGEAIARRKVILVTLNYRLGCFGFFAHPDLNRRLPAGQAGNNAIRDQQAALRWVQDNIAAFGGDPGNITIFGQSAGGGSVISHLYSPLSAGLFQRAIVQSGFRGVNEYGRGTLAETEDWCVRCCDYLGKTVDELLAMPTEELLDNFNRAEKALGLIPRQAVDGYVFPESPSKIIDDGCLNDIKIMVGSVEGDGGPVNSGETGLIRDLRNLYGDRAEAFMAKYPSDDPKNHGIYAALERSKPWFFPLYFCMKQTSAPSRAYMYHFCPQLPGHNINDFVVDGLAYHSAELWYVFGTLNRCWRDFDERHHHLSNVMTDYWTNFARSGNPNGPDLPPWHAYSIKDEQQKYATMIFTENEIGSKALIDDDVWALAAFKMFPIAH
jgi:para-nitrobenzyl esterase